MAAASRTQRQFKAPRVEHATFVVSSTTSPLPAFPPAMMRLAFSGAASIESVVNSLRRPDDAGTRFGKSRALERREGRRLSAGCHVSASQAVREEDDDGRVRLTLPKTKKKKSKAVADEAEAAPKVDMKAPPVSSFRVESRLARLQKPVETPPDGMCFKCRPTGGMVCCEACAGNGLLSRGGYQARNPVNLATILASKWTAHERTFGWRHFRVLNKKKEGDKTVFVEMQATCDPEVRFWVNAQNLKDRNRWSCGWVERADIRAIDDGDLKGGTCRACSGTGSVKCPICSTPDGVLSLD